MAIESPYATRLAAIPVDRQETVVLGSTTRYWVYGDPDAAITIVIVHGYRGEHHGIEPIVAFLPGIRFISPDLPGFGESTPLVGRTHSVEGYAEWLKLFIAHLGLDTSPIVLGHSFGTIVSARAIATGLDAPALILVNPIATSGLSGPRKFATKVTVGYYAVASKLPERIGVRLLNSWIIVQAMSLALIKTKEPALRRWIHNEHHEFFSRFATRAVVVEGFTASVSTDVSAFAEKISIPTLLVAARLDDIAPIAAQYELERLMPDATLRVLDGVGHLIHYEQPQQAAHAIAEFLDGLGAK